MNPRNIRKAKRVGAFLKVAIRMLKYDRWNDDYRSYQICTGSMTRPFHRRELIMVIEKNKQLLKELLK